MSQTLKTAITVVGIDIGKNSFHIVGLDQRGAIVLRQKWSRGRVEARFAPVSPPSRRRLQQLWQLRDVHRMRRASTLLSSFAAVRRPSSK